MKIVISAILLLVTAGLSLGQDRYMVFFTDKAGSTYSVNDPAAFLSERSISRRQRQAISIVENDLPVNESYVEAVKNLGIEVYYRTKWMNGILVQMDVAQLASVEALGFVSSVEYVAPGAPLSPDSVEGAEESEDSAIQPQATDFQNDMLGLREMNWDGFRGEGLLIGVFDEGFKGLSTLSSFQTLRDGRITYTFDYTSNREVVDNNINHGTQVLSILAAASPDYGGIALEADYILTITEASGEYRVEEYYWLFSAEQADSAGVDIINTSLGYSLFDDPDMDYTLSNLDGQTTVITQASNLAASKGIALITSAGNTGLSLNWPRVTAPGDSPNVLTVGSVNSVLERARNSSTGPTADNRIKPDVVALGIATAVIGDNDQPTFRSGTSFAAPIVTGLLAGLWERYPDLTAAEVVELIRLSASQYDTPDNELGYGIPKYTTAIGIAEEIDLPTVADLTAYPNPTVDGILTLAFNQEFFGEAVQIAMVNAGGQRVDSFSLRPTERDNRFPLNLSNHPAGIYLLRIAGVGGVITKKVIKY